jgi:hypothetical protein
MQRILKQNLLWLLLSWLIFVWSWYRSKFGARYIISFNHSYKRTNTFALKSWNIPMSLFIDTRLKKT